MNELRKYPRTPHLAGSRFQPGDDELAILPFKALAGRQIVVEEKVDGANAGISFGADGALLLQSRGHFLDGGPRERQFALFKAWAGRHERGFRDALGTRYVVYGEWLYAKHTIFYDALPHYFLEYDVLDRETGAFLSTPDRRRLLGGLPLLPVRVIYSGPAKPVEPFVGPSAYKSARWRDALPDGVRGETDLSDLMEGLYIKVEQKGCVTARAKFIRASFLQAVADSGSHWMDRPIVPNQLAPGVDLF